MKPSLSYVLLLLFIITTQSLISYTTTSTAADTGNIVKDSKGKKVLDNVPYHVGPVKSANGGRITLTNTMNNKKICPLNVVQDPSEDNVGEQFKFTRIGNNFDDKYLHTSSILSMDSGYPGGGCEKSTFWTIVDAEGPPPSNLITTGEGFDESVTCFQLVEYPKLTSPDVPSYMLQHCPTLCPSWSPTGPETCFNISIYLDNGVRRLGLTGGTPFEFVFYKIKASHDNM